MKQYVLYWLFLGAIVGCKPGGKYQVAMDKITGKDLRVQEKEFHGTRIMLTYMPPCMMADEHMEADTSEVVFKLNIFSAQLKDAKSKEAAQALSYGIDTLFTLVSAQDSFPPLLAQRIANGNMQGAEYLLVFDRMALQNKQQVALVFKDWLFTNVRMAFPVSIFKIDSISCGL